MQAVTRNPLADPSILGVNTGASLFVVIGITLFNITSAGEYIWLALIGASITAVFVFGIGSMGRGGATPIKLLLAGAATSAALIFPCNGYYYSKRLCSWINLDFGKWEVSVQELGIIISFSSLS